MPEQPPPRKRVTELRILLILLVIATFVSAIKPHDWLTWFLEAFPVLLGGPFLLWLQPKLALSHLVMRLLALNALVLLWGAHYTYALAPPGEWIKDWLHLERNHYDRFGHFLQGVVPAMLARELLLRRSSLKPGKWVFFLVVCICLAVSACYELIEWVAAEVLGQGADAFLGMQGDPWDTQWDMFFALIGAICAQLWFARMHDRHLARLEKTRG